MILDKFSLKDKVAIVTGANTGLGQGICWAFAEAGAKIAGVGRSDMTQTREYIEKIGGEFFEIKADLMSSDCVLPILDSTVSHYGKVDILVNNAGIIRRDDLENYSMKDWDDVMNTNIRTLFFLSQEAGRRMIAQGHGGNPYGSDQPNDRRHQECPAGAPGRGIADHPCPVGTGSRCHGGKPPDHTAGCRMF